MTEQEIHYLTSEIGLSTEAAQLRMRDSDLWILDPEFRFDEDLEGEEGVRDWELTAQLAQAVAEMVASRDTVSPAAKQLVWDAAARAEEALRRARERVV